jgi:hypothetical protein
VEFQIHVEYTKITIKRTIIDEGATTCVMCLTCWKSIGSPTLSQSIRIHGLAHPFIWDEQAHESFNALKKSLVSTPLLKPPNYNRDYFLYIVVSEGMIGMVLVQEDDELHEHIVYYLSRNLVSPELNYSHIEKLALAAIHAVQRLQNYIFLWKTTVVADINPFQYVLTRRIIGGKMQ